MSRGFSWHGLSSVSSPAPGTSETNSLLTCSSCMLCCACILLTNSACRTTVFLWHNTTELLLHVVAAFAILQSAGMRASLASARLAGLVASMIFFVALMIDFVQMYDGVSSATISDCAGGSDQAAPAQGTDSELSYTSGSSTGETGEWENAPGDQPVPGYMVWCSQIDGVFAMGAETKCLFLMCAVSVVRICNTDFEQFRPTRKKLLKGAGFSIDPTVINDLDESIDRMKTFSLLILIRYVKDTKRWMKHYKTSMMELQSRILAVKTIRSLEGVLDIVGHLVVFVVATCIVLVLLPLTAALALLMKLSQVAFIGRPFELWTFQDLIQFLAFLNNLAALDGSKFAAEDVVMGFLFEGEAAGMYGARPPETLARKANACQSADTLSTFLL